MNVYDRWHKSRPAAGEPKCKCRPAKVPTAEHGQGKRWQVRWRDEAGTPQKLNFERLPDAESKAAQVKASLDRGDYVNPRAGQVTLKAYGQQWRDTLTCDPATLMQINTRLGKWVFGRKISDYPMATLAKSPSLMQAWIKEMQEGGLQPSTLRGVVTWVSIIFNAALDDGIVNRNPLLVKSVRTPKVVDKQVVPWTLATVNAVAEGLPDRYSAMVYLGAGCAHRQGEVFAVAVDDVDFLQRVVHVRRQVRIINGKLVFSLPKRDKVRSVPLPDAIGMRLSAHIQRFPPVSVTLPWRTPDGAPHTAELLFTTDSGNPLNRNGFNPWWRSARDAAGVPATRDNGMHVLRHTAASAWLAQGVDIRTVAEYLGHDDPGFTLRVYSHLMPNAADRARKAMNAFFEGAADVSSALDVPSSGSE
ncbi:tyrosine-type recombinase/integrase [Nonomuraea sp. NPDC049714]|uniref:tyrosine-type recombinase/integrase n=1 Tax=Nonomuraea sp. NPDC049714 TaxID=3364357 RepID=UPI0037985216